jgi:hypothetical protein
MIRALLSLATAFLVMVGCTTHTQPEPERIQLANMIRRAEAGDVEAMYQIFVDVGMTCSIKL